MLGTKNQCRRDLHDAEIRCTAGWLETDRNRDHSIWQVRFHPGRPQGLCAAFLGLLLVLAQAVSGCGDDRRDRKNGELGGACLEDGTCHEGLVCNEAGVCILPPDSCDGVTCSDHGSCLVSEGLATCDCDPGYQARGLTCVPNEDQTPPVISDLSADATGSALIAVTWRTDEPATSVVRYGVDGLDLTMENTDLVEQHRILLSRLQTETTYQIQVRSADQWGNESQSETLQVSTNGIDALQVRHGHPILFANEAILDQARQKTEELADYHDWVKRVFMDETDDPSDTSTIRAAMDALSDYNPQSYSLYYAVDAHLNGDALAKAYALQLAESLVDWTPTFSGGDTKIRTALFALGVLYDWLYEDMSADLRQRIRAQVLDILDSIDETRPSLLGPSIYGHTRLGNICALVGLLPLFYDMEQDGAEQHARYLAWLDRIVSNWRRYMLADQEYASQGGMNQMGWAYGTSYASMEPYLAWKYAVDEESWFSDWQGELFYAYLYGMRHNDVTWGDKWDTFPFWGDVWGTFYAASFHANRVLVAASGLFYGNEKARYLYTQLLPATSLWKDPMNLLYQDFPDDAGSPPDDLPMSRLFPNSGYLLIRDRWDDPSRNTLIVFRSGTFYSFNHNHRDMNAFTVFYKGPLAIDSGGYNVCGQWGSNHWWNYYIRSVAHNTVLVYDPDEEFAHGSTRLSNDGGQRLFEERSPHVEDMVEGGSNHLDGMVAYEETGDYTYALGDATRAYDPAKLSKFQRSLVSLRNHSDDHPAIVIYDDVVSTDPSFPKAYLLHSIEEPTLDGNMVVLHIDTEVDKNDQAYLFQQTLLPESHDLRVVGGPGQEFLVDDDGSGNPHNYIEDCSGNGYRSVEREKGAWRVETRPTDDRAQDFFLHVLSVADAGPDARPVTAQLLESSHLRGALVADPDGNEATIVLFAEQGSQLDEILDLPAGHRASHVLIVGLEPNARYKLDIGTDQIVLKRDDQESLTASSQGTIYETIP